MSEVGSFISEMAMRVRSDIPIPADPHSLESGIRDALDMTAMFFDPHEEEKVDFVWIESTFEDSERVIQKATGTLKENPALKDGVFNFIRTGFRRTDIQVKRVWEVPSVPKVALAEVQYPKELRLGWFRLG
jgi:hypothetical protein